MGGSEEPNPEGTSPSESAETDVPATGLSTVSPPRQSLSQAPHEPSATSSSSASAPRTRMLLACDRCRSRKSKCDRNVPSCTACLQAGVSCMSAERDRFLSSDGRHVPRGYIEDLERQVQDLEGQYRNILFQTGTMRNQGSGFMGGTPAITIGIESKPGAFMPGESNTTNSTLIPQLQPMQTQDPSSPVGDPLSFENTLLQAIKLSGSDPLRAAAPNLLFDGLSAAFNNYTAIHLIQNMDRKTVMGAINTYFDFVHAHYPLLVQEDVGNKYNIISQHTYEAGMISPAEELVVYMVVIIGMTVSAKLRSVPIFPQMLYYSALRTPHLFDDIESIPMMQALILIVVYSLYDPCAGSSWHLLDIVVSKCLSMGLHLISSTLGNGIESTSKAWAFWTLYSLDRMSGASMGRPFTIANDDIITVPLPGVRQPGHNDGTGFLSGALITYFQILYRARQNPEAGFTYWESEFLRWRNSTKEVVSSEIHMNSANPGAHEYIDAMNTYVDLIYYQGLLLVPQFNVEFPTITTEIIDLWGSQNMYHAAKMVGLSFSVHRFPLAWTAGYKAFATGMSYLLSLTQIDRTTVNIPEVYHVSTACINTIENVAGKFDGLTPYGKFLVKSVDMMLRLLNVETGNSAIGNDPQFLYKPYSDAIPRSPNSGVPRPPDVSELHVRKFRSLSRLFLLAMEDIRKKMFPNT